MVKKPTVIVLGAAASHAYGFPLGPQLKANIVSSLSARGPGSAAAIIAAATGEPMADIERFRSELAGSNAPSIDAFMQATGTFDQIGRCAIALELLQLESDDRLFPVQDDWYGVLFSSVLRDPLSMRENLRVITFNFDRSYERRLFHDFVKRIEGTALGDDPYLHEIFWNKVVHVHGSLGHPTWQTIHVFGGSMMRDYVPSTEPGRVSHASQNIRIFPDAITDGMSRVVAESLDWAERVMFLGFSYHPTNVLKLLSAPDLLLGKDVRGTVFGMKDATIEEARALIGRNFLPLAENHTVFSAVQECEWFREG